MLCRHPQIWGDVEIYISEQQAILNLPFHKDYQGGMLQFVEDYEVAFSNIEYVKRKQQLSGRPTGEALHTDEGKRSIFVRNFTVVDLTDTLIENVEAVTNTWDSMVDELRRRLAKRNSQVASRIKAKAHHTTRAVTEEHGVSLPQTTRELDYQSMLTSFVQALNADWKVGYQLWKNLPKELQQELTKVRHQCLPMESGGNNAHNNRALTQIHSQMSNKGVKMSSKGNQATVTQSPRTQCWMTATQMLARS